MGNPATTAFEHAVALGNPFSKVTHCQMLMQERIRLLHLFSLTQIRWRDAFKSSTLLHP